MQLDKEPDKIFMGYVVAANPFAQMLFSPLVGWWGNRRGSVRLPLLLTLAIFTLASALYSSIEIIPIDYKYMMIASRLLVGVSSGMFSFYLCCCAVYGICFSCWRFIIDVFVDEDCVFIFYYEGGIDSIGITSMICDEVIDLRSSK